MKSTWWQLVGVGFFITCTGCSQLLGRGGLSKLGLPSPQATIAAAEKKSSTASTASKPAPSKPGRATEAEVADVLTRGRTLENSGQFDKARKIYESALREHPQNASLLHRLGIVADRQKKYGEAEQFFLAAIKQEPRNAEVLGDLGYCYYLQARLDKAHAALAQAVALDPSNPRHRNNLGLVLGHQQDYDGAFEQFCKAGSEADAYYNMAFLFAAQDLTDEAKGCFQEALAADPAHRRAKEALASFEEYDRLPSARRDQDAALADSGVKYVPYIEGAESGHGDGGVQPASTSTNLPASRDVGRTTRTLQLQSRGLLSRHMQQQRQLSAGANSTDGNRIEVQSQ